MSESSYSKKGELIGNKIGSLYLIVGDIIGVIITYVILSCHFSFNFRICPLDKVLGVLSSFVVTIWKRRLK